MKLSAILKVLFQATIILMLAICSGCAEKEVYVPEPYITPNILAIAKQKGHTDFVKACEVTGLDELLIHGDSLTIFVPRNDDFQGYLEWNEYPTDDFEAIPKDELKKLLNRHIFLKRYEPRDIFPAAFIESRDSSGPGNTAITIHTNLYHRNTVNGIADLGAFEEGANNSVFLGLDEVLHESNIWWALNIIEDQCSIFQKACRRCRKNSQFERAGTTLETAITGFIPTDKAFEQYFSDRGIEGINDLSQAEIESLVGFHQANGNVRVEHLNTSIAYGETHIQSIIPELDLPISRADGEIKLGHGATIIQPNIQESNGVLHIIDKVLVP